MSRLLLPDGKIMEISSGVPGKEALAAVDPLKKI